MKAPPHPHYWGTHHFYPAGHPILLPDCGTTGNVTKKTLTAWDNRWVSCLVSPDLIFLKFVLLQSGEYCWLFSWFVLTEKLSQFPFLLRKSGARGKEVETHRKLHGHLVVSAGWFWLGWHRLMPAEWWHAPRWRFISIVSVYTYLEICTYFLLYTIAARLSLFLFNSMLDRRTAI